MKKINLILALTLSGLFSSAQISNTSFEPRDNFATGNTPRGMVLGDFDNDGKNDAVVSNYTDHTISVFRNISSVGNIVSCSFGPKANFGTAGQPRVVCVNDLDKDGKLDIAVVCYLGNVVSVFRNTSSGPGIISFGNRQDFAVGNNPAGLVVADVNMSTNIIVVELTLMLMIMLVKKQKNPLCNFVFLEK